VTVSQLCQAFSNDVKISAIKSDASSTTTTTLFHQKFHYISTIISDIHKVSFISQPTMQFKHRYSLVFIAIQYLSFVSIIFANDQNDAYLVSGFKQLSNLIIQYDNTNYQL